MTPEQFNGLIKALHSIDVTLTIIMFSIAMIAGSSIVNRR